MIQHFIWYFLHYLDIYTLLVMLNSVLQFKKITMFFKKTKTHDESFKKSRKAIIKKTKDKKCCQGSGENGTLIHCD